MSKRQIIALGGGGFSMEPDNPLLDNYILHQSASDYPKVCFIPTASGDSTEYIANFYHHFKKKNCHTSHLGLFEGHTSDIKEFVLSQDIVYVGGGNTRNLIVLWKEWGLDHILYQAYQQGIVIAGISAGAICWFEQGVSTSIPTVLSTVNGLGWIKGSFCPHFDGDERRRPAFHRLLQANQIQSGYGVDDGAAIHFVNDSVYKMISSESHKRIYQLSVQNERLVEDVLIPEFLGSV